RPHRRGLHAGREGRRQARGLARGGARCFVRAGLHALAHAARRDLQGRLRHGTLCLQACPQGHRSGHRAGARVRRADADGLDRRADDGGSAQPRVGRQGLALAVDAAGRSGRREGPGNRRSTMSDGKTLYERLGGYDAITAVVNDLLPRLQGDSQLGRFWAHGGAGGVAGGKQLLIDFLCNAAGGPMYYTGRSMKLSHYGMRISESDWSTFLNHAAETLAKFKVGPNEQRDVVAFVQGLKKEIVE